MNVTGRRIRTLIVHDGQAPHFTIQKHLDQSAIFDIVGFADNGSDAVAQCATLQPDLVIMALNMPIMNGLEATRLMKKMPQAPRIIIVSGEDASAIRATLEAGADGFWDKQRALDDLVAQIRFFFPDVSAS